jgi:hypothetical protein
MSFTRWTGTDGARREIRYNKGGAQPGHCGEGCRHGHSALDAARGEALDGHVAGDGVDVGFHGFLAAKERTERKARTERKDYRGKRLYGPLVSMLTGALGLFKPSARLLDVISEAVVLLGG